MYVANKSAAGFDVVELNDGRSNVSFTWQLVANRADAVDAQGQVTSAFADLRFPLAPPRPVTYQAEMTSLVPPPVPCAVPVKLKR